MKISKRLYVISDLHIGGNYPCLNDPTDRGFRICSNVPKLAQFIREIGQRGKSDNIATELIINGDFIDFLAEEWTEEERWRPYIENRQDVVERLTKIIERDQLLFEALADFLASGHQLTILLGNHDVELCLPDARRVLYKALKADKKNISFIYDGEAYSVGKVIIEHGNRYDGFNVINHDKLRHLRAAHSRLEELPNRVRFNPPPGSLLVSRVINEVKKRYPFIDLLKPETLAAIPILLALAPEYQKHIFYISSLYLTAQTHNPGKVGQPRYAGDINAVDTIKEQLRKSDVSSDKIDAFFQDLESFNDMAVSSEPMFQGDIAAGTLKTTWSYLKLLTAGQSEPVSSRLPSLLTALEATRSDYSFDRAKEIQTYIEPAKRLLDRGFDVVIFGHTHLAKQISLENGLYINTGTWADLIKFPYEIVDLPKDEAIIRLDKFANDLETKNLRPYIDFSPTYAEIEFLADGEVFTAVLRDHEVN